MSRPRASSTPSRRRRRTAAAAAGAWLCALVLPLGCGRAPGSPDRPPRSLDAATASRVTAEVEAALWAFHAADTSRSPEGVVALLWPEYAMLVDGVRMEYDAVADGARTFLPSLSTFHTEWTDVVVQPLSPDLAIASFRFRDSLVTRSGERIRSSGGTTFVWQRRGGEWRVLYGDADHYPIDR